MTRLIAALVVAGTLALGACTGRPVDGAAPGSPGAVHGVPEAPASGPATGASTAVAAPAQAYVDAVNSRDLDALVAAFAADGQVIDVSRRIQGGAAIRTWASGEVIGGRLQVLAVTPMPGGQDLLVHWAPAGSAGWRAHYRFTMTDTKITTADLQYA